MQHPDHAQKIEQIRKAIAEKPDGILESLAAEFAVPVQTVLECVPGDGVVRIDGSRFVDVLTDIAEWGDITFIVHTKDAVVEVCGPMPTGRIGHGMYNLPGGIRGLSRPPRLRRPFALQCHRGFSRSDHMGDRPRGFT